MKQIRHTLINQEKPMDQVEWAVNMQQIFEWANKVGREGRMVSYLQMEPTSATCIEYVTDDDYTLMLKTGKIVENKEDGVEESNGAEEGKTLGEAESGTGEA